MVRLVKTSYHLVRVSGNAKTGPIPVSTSSASTCPVACPLKGNGCYAETGPLGMHWRKVTTGERGVALDEFCTQIARLPKGQLWRYAQAGDLPGDGVEIDDAGLSALVRANKGRRGFGYTHYDPEKGQNGLFLARANADGFTINLSANNLAHADALAGRGAPVVTLLPPDQRTPTKTPAGRFVAVCPAVVRDDVSCATCGICANPHRSAIIGFPAHGVGAKKAHRVFTIHQQS